MVAQRDSIYAIVLAAGKGTRMKSSKAKVLHETFFEPMIFHVLDALQTLSVEETVVITGHQAEHVEEVLAPYDTTFVRQHEQLGTGHAVLTAEKVLAGKQGTALIICGDTPLVKQQTLQEMLDGHLASSAALTVMTTILDNPANYGRIVSNESGSIEKIVEQKDADSVERLIKEINAGIYCVDCSFLFTSLKKVGTDNMQGEVYLTDIVEIARQQGVQVEKYLCADPQEITGVNSRVELARATKILQARRNHELMMDGVSMVDPESVFVEKTVTIGSDTIIHPNCYLTGTTCVGKGCEIEPFCRLTDCQVGDGEVVRSFSHLKS